jgi:hypothetical protein
VQDVFTSLTFCERLLLNVGSEASPASSPSLLSKGLLLLELEENGNRVSGTPKGAARAEICIMGCSHHGVFSPSNETPQQLFHNLNRGTRRVSYLQHFNHSGESKKGGCSMCVCLEHSRMEGTVQLVHASFKHRQLD